ncbi:MAG: GAF domain-containing protein [Cyclobacteriaceae bacterium]|nr:GAF domain-containing protein [Cyclobacteriaceae bacterium]
MVPLLALLIKGLRASLFWLLISIITTSVNLKYVNATFGDFYTIEINEFNFYVFGILFCISYIAVTLTLYSLLSTAYNDMKSKNKELDIFKNKVEEKKLLLEKYQHNLLKLSKDESISSKEKKQLFKIICKTAVKTLEISRVSIWLFGNEKSIFERHFLYELDKESDELVTLRREDFPKYFEAVKSKPYISAIDAKKHPDTMEFKDKYLSPLGIYSMLDCPIIIDRETFGVICCEHKNELKEWSTEDELYVQFLANFISLGIKNSHVKLLLDDIVDKNNELIGKNKEIESINEELNFVNEELKTINDSLEETVKNRTFELESQNKQLSEYAFINSHLLRAPLSRVLGLSDLISREVTIPKDVKLLNSLAKSTFELDSIIKKISDILYDGNHITREDVNSIINKNLKEEGFE